MAKKFDLSVVFSIVDKVTAPVKKIGGSVNKLNSTFKKMSLSARVAFSKVDVALRKLDRRFEKISRKIERSGFTRIGKRMTAFGKEMAFKLSLPIIAFGAFAIRSATNFQRAMNMVGAVTRATGDEFKELNLLAKQLGKTTAFSASEAADGMKFLGMAGLTVNQIMGALPRTLELAASAQIDLGTAADIVTNIMSGYRMETSDLAKVNDVLVNAFTSSNTDLQQLGEAMKVVGPVAKAMQFRFKETAAALGILAKNAFQGTLGGTGLRRIMTNLVSLSPKATKAFKNIGVEVFNTDGTLKDLTLVIEEFEDAQARGVDQMKITQAVMEAFGQRGGPQFLALFGAGSKALKKFEKDLDRTGTAADIAKAQLKGLPGAFKLLASAFEAVQLAITDSGFGNWIENVTRKLVAFLQNLSETNPELLAAAAAIAGIIAVIGPLVIGLGFLAIAIGALSAVSTPILIVIAAISAAILGLIGLAVLMINAWGPVKEFWADLWEDFKLLKDVLPNFIKKKLGIEITPERDLNDTSGLSDINKRLLGIDTKSETKIDLRVSSDSGSTVAVDKVRNKGPANVSLATVGYVGV